MSECFLAANTLTGLVNHVIPSRLFCLTNSYIKDAQTERVFVCGADNVNIQQGNNIFNMGIGKTVYYVISILTTSRYMYID